MKKVGWTTNYIDDLNFMASQGSQIFNTMEMLEMEKRKKKSMTSSLELVLHI